MTALWLKALHVAAVLAWSGGLVSLCVAMAALWRAPAAALPPQERRLGRAVLAWDRRVTVPSMLAVWLLGFALARHAGWLGDDWLHGKLAVAVALSGLHGVVAATLRRRVDDGLAAGAPWMRWAPIAAVAGLAVVALLVVLKP